jgi:hypothetical protein
MTFTKEEADKRRTILTKEIQSLENRADGSWKEQPSVKEALSRFAEVWEHDQPMSIHYDTEEGDWVKDLLADIIHYCELYDVMTGGFEAVLESARNHAEAEWRGE